MHPADDRLTAFANRPEAPETQGMRILYLTLGLFILLNIGAACRTPPPAPQGCEPVSGGLIRCKGDAGQHHE
jgi:hypothetical protein